jgi:hypothetical protein
VLYILCIGWEDGEEVENVRSKHESVSSEYETDRNCEDRETEKDDRDGEQSRTGGAGYNG